MRLRPPPPVCWPLGVALWQPKTFRPERSKISTRTVTKSFEKRKEEKSFEERKEEKSFEERKEEKSFEERKEEKSFEERKEEKSFGVGFCRPHLEDSG